MTASRYVPPVLKRVEACCEVVYHAPRNGLAAMGHLITFLVRSIGAVPLAFRQKQPGGAGVVVGCRRADAIVVGGGTVGVMVILGVMGGATVGIEGYTALNLLGMSPVTGGLSVFATTREIAPLLAATAFTAQSGCRFTAQLGSMRIAEEIDALEAIAIRPLPYLVTTRMCAAVLAIIPLYLVSLAANYLACEGHVHSCPPERAGRGHRPGRLPFVHPVVGHGVLVHQGDRLRIADDVHPVLLRILRRWGARRRGSCRRTNSRLAIIVIVFANLIMTLAFWGTSPGIQILGTRGIW